MNENFYEEDCKRKIKSILTEEFTIKNKEEFIIREDGTRELDIDFYFYKDINFFNNPFVIGEHLIRVGFCFEIARNSPEWVKLIPCRSIKRAVSGIICEFDGEKISFSSSKNRYMPYAHETTFKECIFLVKNWKTNKFEKKKDYVNEDIRKVAISSLHLCKKWIEELKENFNSVQILLFPIVLTQQSLTTTPNTFNYNLTQQDLKLPFLKDLDLTNLEPISIFIHNSDNILEFLELYMETYNVFEKLKKYNNTY
jgi:hypothetical protein